MQGVAVIDSKILIEELSGTGQIQRCQCGTSDKANGFGKDARDYGVDWLEIDANTTDSSIKC